MMDSLDESVPEDKEVLEKLRDALGVEFTNVVAGDGAWARAVLGITKESES